MPEDLPVRRKRTAEMAGSYDWIPQLTEPGFCAAPVSCFKHVSIKILVLENHEKFLSSKSPFYYWLWFFISFRRRFLRYGTISQLEWKLKSRTPIATKFAKLFLIHFGLLLFCEYPGIEHCLGTRVSGTMLTRIFGYLCAQMIFIRLAGVPLSENLWFHPTVSLQYDNYSSFRKILTLRIL